MTTTVTTHPTSGHVTMIASLPPLTSDTSGDSYNMSPTTSMSLPSSPVPLTGMTRLLNSRNLVQDEKLAVATLATLNSGTASNLIKQDLKWVIQSRRKAEGKVELQVEFKKPVKDKLSTEELIKRTRRRELNRLAARRSREKGQKRKDMLVEEILKLQSQNTELMNILCGLTEERDSIVEILRQHMKQCSDYQATQSAAVGISQRVLDLLSFSTGHPEVQGMTDLYICKGDKSVPAYLPSPSVIVKQETPDYSPSPLVITPSSVPSGATVYDDSSSVIYNLSSPLVGCTTPLVSPKIESAPLPQSEPRLISYNSSIEDTSMSTESTTAVTDDEVIPYKHKLMKHRKQYSCHPQPSSTSGPGSRVSLERSFSFPCMGRESRPCLGSSSTEPYTPKLPQFEIIGLPPTPSPTPILAALDSDINGASIYTSLDLAAKRAPDGFSDLRKENHFGPASVETWIPAGTRARTLPRNIERRWSVDQSTSQQHLPEPLNLSRKDTLDESMSPDAISCTLRNSQSYFTSDSYR